MDTDKLTDETAIFTGLKSVTRHRSSPSLPSKRLSTHGWEFQWASKPLADALRCGVCTQVARDAVAHTCGQLYCQDCQERAKRSGSKCSRCKTTGSLAAAYRDRSAVLELQLLCPKQCGATLRLNGLGLHLTQGCVSTANNSEPRAYMDELGECARCKARMLPTQLPAHQNECPERDINCTFCHQKVAVAELTTHMREDCVEHPRPCTLGCGVNVRRRDLSAHLNDASLVGAHLGVVVELKKAVSALSFELGQLYIEGAVTKNTERGTALVLAAARMDPSKAVQLLLEPTGKSGMNALSLAKVDPAAAFLLGQAFEMGEGTTHQDMKKAAIYYRLAAEQGHAQAQTNLGLSYLKGQGVERDGKQAVHFLQAAAAQHHPQAQYHLGMCYYDGVGVEEDLDEAINWLTRASQKGSVEAQSKLGDCYFNGEGVEADVVRAVEWYQKAAQQGDVDAQCKLGSCYYTGQGVPEDVNEAQRYFRLAAEQGHVIAQERLTKLFASA